jgi:hypothetical protein
MRKTCIYVWQFGTAASDCATNSLRLSDLGSSPAAMAARYFSSGSSAQLKLWSKLAQIDTYHYAPIKNK